MRGRKRENAGRWGRKGGRGGGRERERGQRSFDCSLLKIVDVTVLKIFIFFVI